MAVVKKATMADWNKVGIHLVAPTKPKIEQAKEDADNQGYNIVWVLGRLWVHRKGSEVGIKKRMKK